MLFNQNKQSIALKIIIHIFSPEKGDENSFLCSHLQLEDIEKMVEQKKYSNTLNQLHYLIGFGIYSMFLYK